MTKSKAQTEAEAVNGDEGGELLAHPGTDDATQRRIHPDGAPASARARHARRGGHQSGGVDVVNDEVAGRQYDTELDPMRPYLDGVDEEVYRKQYILLPSAEGFVTTDCTNDVVYSALNQGFRPVGDARLDGAVDHPDGLHKIVTWVVPVQSAREVDADTVTDVKARLSEHGHDVKHASDREDPVVGYRRGERDVSAENPDGTPADRARQPRTGPEAKRDQGE